MLARASTYNADGAHGRWTADSGRRTVSVVSDTGFRPAVSHCGHLSGGYEPSACLPRHVDRHHCRRDPRVDEGTLLRRPMPHCERQADATVSPRGTDTHRVCELVGGGRRGKDAACTPLRAVLGSAAILDGTAVFVVNRLCKQAAHAWNTLQAQGMALAGVWERCQGREACCEPQRRLRVLARP